MVEIKNGILATKFLEKYIKLFKYKKNDEYIIIKQDNKINNLLIDENYKYLISINEDNYFKFFNINEIIKKNFEHHMDNKYVDLIPSYQFKHDSNILELINIENYSLCGRDDKNLFIYEYNVIDQTSKLVNKISIEVKNIKLIKGKKEKYICCQDNYNLYLLSIPDLMPVNKIKNQNSIISYEQINKNEIIICDSINLKILNINNFTFKISKKNCLNNIFYLKKLKDNSILIGGRCNIKRYCLKKLEELPELINVEEENDDDDELPEFLNNLNRDDKDILYIDELANGKIIIFLRHNINVYELGNYN